MILSFDTITNLKLIFEFQRKVWEILRVTSVCEKSTQTPFKYS